MVNVLVSKELVEREREVVGTAAFVRVRGVLDRGEGDQGTVVAEPVEACRPEVPLAVPEGGGGLEAQKQDRRRRRPRVEMPAAIALDQRVAVRNVYPTTTLLHRKPEIGSGEFLLRRRVMGTGAPTQADNRCRALKLSTATSS